MKFIFRFCYTNVEKIIKAAAIIFIFFEDGCWVMEDGRWMMEDGCWVLGAGGWRMEDRRWLFFLTPGAPGFFLIKYW